jgi:hypothetical protein
MHLNPSGHVVSGVVLRPLACWDCGFAYRLGHGSLSLVSAVNCQVEVSLCDELITRPEQPYRVWYV